VHNKTDEAGRLWAAGPPA